MLQEGVLEKSRCEPLGFRDLSPEELELIAGGYWTDGYGNGEIVIGGSSGGGTGGGYGPPGGGIGGYGWGGGSSGGSSTTTTPPNPDYSDEEWDPNGDDDGDGIVNQNEEIGVVANLTADQAKIAHAIASQLVTERMIVFGALFGVAGMELKSLLKLIGVSNEVAAGVVGSATASGAVTSVNSALADMSDDLTNVYQKFVEFDMVQNPDKYSSWMIHPFTGEPFDANSSPYNPND
ncbi:MAG: hypothetical protein LCH74_00330 [Proteobacteria bacterium]|nr:hypothetical protein [Pseudomonadota bacterium]